MFKTMYLLSGNLNHSLKIVSADSQVIPNLEYNESSVIAGASFELGHCPFLFKFTSCQVRWKQPGVVSC